MLISDALKEKFSTESDVLASLECAGADEKLPQRLKVRFASQEAMEAAFEANPEITPDLAIPRRALAAFENCTVGKLVAFMESAVDSIALVAEDGLWQQHTLARDHATSGKVGR